jgi:hypothetical protein
VIGTCGVGFVFPGLVPKKGVVAGRGFFDEDGEDGLWQERAFQLDPQVGFAVLAYLFPGATQLTAFGLDCELRAGGGLVGGLEVDVVALAAEG